MHQVFLNVHIYAKQKINLTWPHILYESDTIKSTHNRIIRLYFTYVVSDGSIFDFA